MSSEPTEDYVKIIKNILCACGQPETSEHLFTCLLDQDSSHDMQRSFIDIQIDLNYFTRPSN